jgi:hypothetical protein
MLHGDSIYTGVAQQLMKNTLQIVTLFAFFNLFMARNRLLAKMRVVRQQMA